MCGEAEHNVAKAVVCVESNDDFEYLISQFLLRNSTFQCVSSLRRKKLDARTYSLDSFIIDCNKDLKSALEKLFLHPITDFDVELYSLLPHPQAAITYAAAHNNPNLYFAPSVRELIKSK